MEILLDPKEVQKNISKARSIIESLVFHLPVRILSKFFKRKKAKPYRLLILRNAGFRFLICGMPDFLLYDIFYAFLKLSSKGKQVLYPNNFKKKNNKKIDSKVKNRISILKREKILILSDTNYHESFKNLLPIFSYLDSLSVGSKISVRSAGLYYYPANSISALPPHILLAENFIETFSNNFTKFFLESGIHKFLINYYSTGYEVYNTRAWKSLAFHDNGSYHLDNLPNKVLKIMIFSGDKEGEYIVNKDNGAFTYLNFSNKKILRLVGRYPCAIIDTTNLDHRAGCIDQNRSRCAIEFTVRPFYAKNEFPKFYEPGFCSAHPVNPFHATPTKKARDLKLTGLAGYSKTF